jgi:hypothetical protein
MKTWKSLAFSGGVTAIAVTTAVLLCTRPATDTRSVGPVAPVDVETSRTFVRAESTGLFVGVQKFPHDPNLSVPFAVDDAVDLAYQFSLDQRSGLVSPQRVVLALSGKPVKKESKERLEKLRSAGVRFTPATTGDILSLLKEQVAQTGPNGILVLSLATHGFLDRNGDAYILGSTSAIGSPETSLRMETLFDTAGQTARSVIFVDACRNRVGQTRGAASDPATAAPLLRKMGQVQGQVVFYAAAADGYAYDDPANENGVFTEAVLDGLACKASAPRGQVIAMTLQSYVEESVRRWIKLNKNVDANPATQFSMEGATRSMPLSQCWRGDRIGEMHVVADGKVLAAYDSTSRSLWRKDLGERIVEAKVADLDADAFEEVVVAFGDRITVLDRDGEHLWTRRANAMPLAKLAVGDLFRKHTNEIVALWTNERTSRLTVFDAAGRERSGIDYPERLRLVAIFRPTPRHAPKIVVTSASTVFSLDPKKITEGTPLWRQSLLSPTDTIQDLSIVDADHDSRWEIAVQTKSGTTRFTFDGKILRQAAARWTAALKKRTHRHKAPAHQDAAVGGKRK